MHQTSLHLSVFLSSSKQSLKNKRDDKCLTSGSNKSRESQSLEGEDQDAKLTWKSIRDSPIFFQCANG